MATTTAIDLGQVSQTLGLAATRVNTVVELLDAGNTVPFITRYRKDQTGGMDEEQIRQVQSRVVKLRLLTERKQTILRSIDSQGKLTPELSAAVAAADTAKRLEDLYLPYKPKKQTLATTARERGLEPLADEILNASPACADLDARANDFVNTDRKVATAADALLGAGHILAEWFSERADFRGKLRVILERSGKLVSTRLESETKTKDKSSEREPAGNAAASPERSAPAADDRSLPAEAVQAPEVLPLFPDESQFIEVKRTAVAEPATSGSAAAASEPACVEPTRPSEPRASVESTSTVEASETAGPTATVEPAASTAPSPGDGQPAGSGTTAPKAKKPKRPRPKQVAKTKKEKDFDKAFRDYFQYSESIGNVPPHRVLAINRGERARVLRVRIDVDLEAMDRVIDDLLVSPEHPHADFLRGCGRDALTRLVLPGLERDVRRELTDRAETHAVEVFARNLRNLLLQPPVRDRRVLAIDPGFKSGCKLVALDEFGNLLEHSVAHMVGSEERRGEGKRKAAEMVRQHQLTVVAVGNGTGCRAAEQWVSDLLATDLVDLGVSYVIVNEAGASVYSTSRLGREELPQYDATVRGGVSIGRRLQDPLSELVKIDPANIGVGMYQHDIKAKHLRDSLDAVVSSCVNYVGVDLNSASPALLRYVSGLNQLTAQRVYDYRIANGPFKSREELKSVQGFGEATFVQAAGFLKIVGGLNALDATWIHPESYPVAEQILQRLEASADDLKDKEGAARLAERLTAVPLEQLASQLNVGTLTLSDIVSQLSRPGRDPRESLPQPIFKRGILKIDDLTPGMELAGTVLNVVDFGAFVDIGLKDTGLVHISQLANRYVQDPHEVVAVGDIVHVWVLEVDKQRRRVSLTMIKPGTRRQPEQRRTDARPAARSQAPVGKPAGEGGPRTPPAHQRPHGRPSRPPATKLPDKPPPKPKGKPRPQKPLSQAMLEGKAPMRTFGDLQQFWAAKQQDVAEQEKSTE
ncbi:MAG TPA: Tex-like N-terminal domain-containing protein [Pirellulales bacterium]|nr:Tex-like N-terminal domain-containing protein [Pirellulales bacterium]